MKIVIDGRMWAWTGIGRITRNLLANLEDAKDGNEYVVLMLAKDFDAWSPRAKHISKELADYAPYSLSEQLGLASHLRKLKPDLVHFLNFNRPIFYFGRSVVTINDLTLIEFKNIRGMGIAKLIYEFKYWAMRLVFHRAVTSASHIITISQFVKDQLLERYTRLKSDHVTVARPAVDEFINKPEGVSNIVENPFLLYVGNSYPHKNLLRLVEAFELMRKEKPELSLVLVGADDYFSGEIKKYATGNKQIIFPGYVSDGQLAGLYKAASLFVFPSLSEGFGLPPLEAMTYGTPCIVAKSSSLPEVCGNAAAYFDPTSAVDISKKTLSLLDDKQELERLRTAGLERIKQFSWADMAKQVLKAYNESK